MANDPFARLPEVPSFTLTSATLQYGQEMPEAQRSGRFGIPGGKDVSPELAWHGAPAATRGYAVTMYDPDAPTMSGFWHWAVAALPASATGLPENAGDDESEALPAGAFQLRNDAGVARYVGAAPPPGHGPHRYFVTVHAVDTDDLGVGRGASPAFLGLNITNHVLARATIVATFEMRQE